VSDDQRGDGRPGQGLAARFRRALSDREETQRRVDEEDRRGREEAQEARRRLLHELESFASDIGVVRVTRGEDGLTFHYGDQALSFRPEGDGDRVRVEGGLLRDAQAMVFRQPELDYRWVYSRRKRSGEDRVPLFDLGLEHLLVAGLGLPDPTAEAAEGEDSPPPGPAAERKL
jgi:hypothetical protein